MLNVLISIYLFMWYLVVLGITFAVALMLLRVLMNAMEVNPFTWPSITTRRLSDPLVNPVRRALIGFGVQPKYSPFVAILLTLLVGYVAIDLSKSVLNMVAGVFEAATTGNAFAVIGYVLYGLLSLYLLMIFIRIILSYAMISHGRRFMRLLVNSTDPLLIPLRRRVPTVGMFDISPMVAILIVWVLQAAVAVTLLKGQRLGFVG